VDGEWRIKMENEKCRTKKRGNLVGSVRVGEQKARVEWLQRGCLFPTGGATLPASTQPP
jgi:hypothetical protein